MDRGYCTLYGSVLGHRQGSCPLKGSVGALVGALGYSHTTDITKSDFS